MMLIPAFSAGVLTFLLAHLCTAREHIPRNISHFPRPGPGLSSSFLCGRGSSSFICDPDGLLITETQVKRLVYAIDRVRGTTPCMCAGCRHQPYSMRTLVVGVAIAQRIYVPPNVTSRHLYLQQLANSIRHKWALGDCRGSENDVLLLYEQDSDQLIFSIGSLVAARIGARCIRQLEDHQHLQLNFEPRLTVAMGALRNAVRTPCCGRSCLYLNDNWYKMLAWVVGGVVIFSALTFFGRRVCARNMYVRSRVRSTGAYPPVGLFGTRPRCSRQHTSRETERNRGGLDPDFELPPGAVLYSTSAPPPYPGVNPMTVQMPPPYVGKPPAYDEVEAQQPQPQPQPQSQSHNATEPQNS